MERTHRAAKRFSLHPDKSVTVRWKAFEHPITMKYEGK